jgi:acyl-CoA thioesterase I
MTLRQVVFSASILFLFAGALPAAARPIHVVAFGDSSTAGYLVAHRDAYPAQLQAALRKKGYNVVVKNAGVSGDTTAGALRRFDHAIDPGTDVAIVEFGTNDLRLGVPAARMRANLNEIVRTLRARGIEVLVIGFGAPLDFAGLALRHDALYTYWGLPLGQYRARDGSHYNAAGYGILVTRMLPEVEVLVKRVASR